MKKRIVSMLLALILVLSATVPAFAQGKTKTVQTPGCKGKIILSGYINTKTEPLDFEDWLDKKAIVYYVSEGSEIQFSSGSNSFEFFLYGYKKRGSCYEINMNALKEGKGSKKYTITAKNDLYAAWIDDGDLVTYINIKVVPDDGKKDEKPKAANEKKDEKPSAATEKKPAADKPKDDKPAANDEKKFDIETLQKQVAAMNKEAGKSTLYDSRITAINNQVKRLNNELEAGKKPGQTDKMIIETQLLIIDVWVDIIQVEAMSVYEKPGAPKKTDKAGLAETKKKLDTLGKNVAKAKKALQKIK